MYMPALLIFVAFCGGIGARSECPTPRYSRMMLDSIKRRKQGIVSSGAASSTLGSGILAQAIQATTAQYGRVDGSDDSYLAAVLDQASRPFANATWAATRPLDRFSVAACIRRARVQDMSLSPATGTAHDAISDSLALQRRNPDGGLWYYVYPEWSYLDGMFSLLPFLAWAAQPNDTEIDLQVGLLRSHCKAAANYSSLLVHGYDWSRKAVWADKVTGASPYVWGRSLGWFLAAMVQTYEGLDCAAAEGRRSLCGMIQETAISISSSLVELADPSSGAWWQLPTLPGHRGNYLESSSTVLFIFSFLKGLRIGLLLDHGPQYRLVARRAYNYTLGHFVTRLGDGNGTIGFNQTVAVCSLNSSATYEYYTSQPIVPNSLLGEAAFLLASLEVERLDALE